MENFTEAASLMSEYVKDSKDSPSHVHGEEKVRRKFSMQLSSATKIELGKAREREKERKLNAISSLLAFVCNQHDLDIQTHPRTSLDQ